ncbi:MAG: FmdB family zinc ribbon protein [Chloroflexota bacterium]
MPIYEYLCPKCGCGFELRRPFSEADAPAQCPSCNTAAKKLLSAFSACASNTDGEASSLAGMGPSCTTCSATGCSTCRLGH